MALRSILLLPAAILANQLPSARATELPPCSNGTLKKILARGIKIDRQTEDNSQERLTARILAGKALPSAREDKTAYGWYYKLSLKDEELWPEMHPQLRLAIAKYAQKKSETIGPQERLTQRVLSGQGLPSAKEDRTTYNWYQRLSRQEPSTWPKMDPQLEAAILRYSASKKSTPISSLDLLTERILAGRGLPTVKEDRNIYSWYYRVSRQDPSSWPQMHPKVREAILEYAHRPQVSSRPAQEVLTEWVLAHQSLPSSKENDVAYRWYLDLSQKDPASWPEMDPKVKTLLFQYTDEKKARISIQERLTQEIAAGKGLPRHKDDPQAYNWYTKLRLKDPSEWPEMDLRLKQAIVALIETRAKRQAQKRISPAAPPKIKVAAREGPQERVTRCVLAGKGLPSQRQDLGAYQWYYAVANSYPWDWPEMDPQVRQEILKYVEELKYKRSR